MKTSPRTRQKVSSRHVKVVLGTARKRPELFQLLADLGAGEQIDPEEAAVLAFGPMRAARAIARKVQLRALLERSGLWEIGPPSDSEEGLRPPASPVATLSWLNCSRVYPPLLQPNLSSPPLPLRDALEKARRAHRGGAGEARLLDLLVCSAGVSWAAAARLLRSIVGRPIAPGTISAAESARLFWRLFAGGRARLLALEGAREVPRWAGDFGYFDRAELAELLPGVILPDHWERAEFLVRYRHEGEPANLELFDLTGSPLCRHPFALRRPHHLLTPPA